MEAQTTPPTKKRKKYPAESGQKNEKKRAKKVSAESGFCYFNYFLTTRTGTPSPMRNGTPTHIAADNKKIARKFRLYNPHFITYGDDLFTIDVLGGVDSQQIEYPAESGQKKEKKQKKAGKKRYPLKADFAVLLFFDCRTGTASPMRNGTPTHITADNKKIARKFRLFFYLFHFPQVKDLREWGVGAKSLINNALPYPTPSVKERLSVCKRHFDLTIETKGEHYGILAMRKHYKNYFSGLQNFKELRIKLLTSNSLNEIKALFLQIEEEYVS